VLFLLALCAKVRQLRSAAQHMLFGQHVLVLRRWVQPVKVNVMLATLQLIWLPGACWTM
jgi:hypothetical protein